MVFWPKYTFIVNLMEVRVRVKIFEQLDLKASTLLSLLFTVLFFIVNHQVRLHKVFSYYLVCFGKNPRDYRSKTALKDIIIYIYLFCDDP